MTSQSSIGYWGEVQACHFLKQKGYFLVARNYRIGRAEIDLIFHHDGVCVFVEVKTRSGNRYGDPVDFVREVQKERILLSAQIFLQNRPKIEEIRFDIASIFGNRKRYELKHWIDAF